MTQKLTLQRLNKQQRQLIDNPIPGVIVKRQGLLNFHFLFYELDGEYKGGYYHGKLQLPQNYPFGPPKLLFLTQSGRFEVNKPICTTFTSYHSEQWSTAWNIRTLLIATQSFMLGDEHGYGFLRTSKSERQKLAKISLAKNMSNEIFKKLFQNDLRKLGVCIPSPSEIPLWINNQNVQRRNKQSTYLAILVAILFILWIYLKIH